MHAYAMRIAIVAAAVVVALVGFPARAHAGRGTALVKLLPDDTNVVGVADMAHARGTGMFKKLFETARTKSDWIDSLGGLEKSVDTIIVGTKLGNTDHF